MIDDPDDPTLMRNIVRAQRERMNLLRQVPGLAAVERELEAAEENRVDEEQFAAGYRVCAHEHWTVDDALCLRPISHLGRHRFGDLRWTG